MTLKMQQETNNNAQDWMDSLLNSTMHSKKSFLKLFYKTEGERTLFQTHSTNLHFPNTKTGYRQNKILRTL